MSAYPNAYQNSYPSTYGVSSGGGSSGGTTTDPAPITVGGGTYRARIITRLNIIAEELALMTMSKMGGLANIKNQDGGTHVDHVGYRMSLLKEQEMLLKALERASEVDDGAEGSYGPFEIITRVDT